MYPSHGAYLNASTRANVSLADARRAEGLEAKGQLRLYKNSSGNECTALSYQPCFRTFFLQQDVQSEMWPHIHDEFTFEMRVDGVLPYIVVASRGIRYSAVPAIAVTFRKGECTRLLVRTRREFQVPKLSSREESFTAVRGSTRDG